MAKAKKTSDEIIAENFQEELSEVKEDIVKKDKLVFQTGSKVKNIKNEKFYTICSFPANLYDHSKVIVLSLENSNEKSVFFKKDLELV